MGMKFEADYVIIDEDMVKFVCNSGSMPKNAIPTDADTIKIPIDNMYKLFMLMIDRFMGNLEGVHKMLYDLRNNNPDKKIKVWVPTERSTTVGPRIYKSYSIGDGVSSEKAVVRILSIWSKFVVDKIDDSEADSLVIELEFPSLDMEDD